MSAAVITLTSFEWFVLSIPGHSGDLAATPEEKSEAPADPLNPENFLEAYDEHYSAILSYLYRLTRDREAAEDLTSEVFMRALRQLRDGKRPLRGRAYLYTIATNAFYTRARKVRTMGETMELVWESLRPAQRNVSEDLSEEARLAAVRTELARLKPKYRAALTLRFDEELSFREVADVMGVAEASARSLVFRGLEKLRDNLRRQGVMDS